MTYPPVLAMWLAMTAIMMAPVVYPWLRALNRIAARGALPAADPDARRPPLAAHASAARHSALRTGGRAAPHPAVRGVRPPSAPRAITSVTPFLGGYMLAWAGFSALAAGVHFALAALALSVPLGMRAPNLSAAALVLTGAFQFTALKQACLSHCRSPAGFLLSHWRPGTVGHARLGLEHGLHCVGCCWALMALALVVGMADLVWMGLLMAVMVAETALPFGARLSRPLGAALIAAGVVVLILGRATFPA